MPSIAESLHASPGAVGLSMTSHSLAFGVGQLAYGALSDRRGRVAVVRWALIAFAIPVALAALCQTPLQFALARFAVGLAAAAALPSTLVFIADNYTYGARQAVIARVHVVMSSAWVVAAVVGGLVARLVSWRALMLTYAALALVQGISMMRLDPGRPGASAPSRIPWSEIVRRPGAAPVYALAVVEGALFLGGMTYLGALIARRYSLGQVHVGFVLAALGVGVIVGGLLVPRMAVAFSERVTALLGGALMSAGYAAFVRTPPLGVFVLGLLAVGAGFAALHTTLQTRASEIHPAARGKAFSLFTFSLFAGSALGAAGLGAMFDAGRASTMLLTCSVGLMATGVCAALLRPTRREPTTQS